MSDHEKVQPWSHPVSEGSPFHKGELGIQEYMGIRHRLDGPARQGIRNYMPEQHREFFSGLQYLLIGSLDDEGHPWASIVTGEAGFVASPDPRQLTISSVPYHGDPLAENLRLGAPVGILGIDFHTRRRNRLNGVVADCSEGQYAVSVSQSFGNCPKYIQSRSLLYQSQDSSVRPYVQPCHYADVEVQNLIGQADTFFIASSYPGISLRESSENPPARAHGVDVSHRGGKPGFIRVKEGGRYLEVPDYSGNFFFNTLGNLLLHPRAGLLFIDFEHGHLLYLSVRCDVLWSGQEVKQHVGAQRLIRMEVGKMHWIKNALPWSWGTKEISPYLNRLSPHGE
ncbi:pyridoxamine 5'-phosphate oxidase family protein [Hahella ganghwensis]|uniref:pyridoxamine 5'-phosphate oxidase family protein n=1 Tax=Hahella ganghwensis TaxID=286420 RepID=UPI0003618BAE|nr:pyridoxamine 5'-phosphate oxidase family protein [Hahella ganghwensis]